MLPHLLLSLVALTMGTPMVSGMLGKQPLMWPPYRAPGATNRTCPCSSPALCQPITSVAPFEGFAFMTENTNYLKYDWTRITTVVVFGAAVDDKIMCYAHSKGVRVSIGAGFPPEFNLTDPETRTIWVEKVVAVAQYNFLDGVNFDFESPIFAWDTIRRAALNSLVSELTKAFKANFVNPQVTFDAGYSPYVPFFRYDYRHIGTTVDFILVMEYDMCWNCWTGANSNYTMVVKGAIEYMAQGISPKHLVLGFPWYGYDYPCESISSDNHCVVEPSCTGVQVPYSGVINSLYKNNTSGRLWDKASVTPFFNRKDATGKHRQTWYDDKESLGVKYKYATTAGLRGVGMWTADSIDYSNTPEGIDQRADMWGALPVVNQHPNKE